MASPIETLYILLKADTSDLKKKFEESEKETKKLQSDLSELSRANKVTGESFLGLAGAASKFIAASGAAAFVISGVKQAIDFGTELSQTSRLLGVNATDLNAWGNAVELAGGDAKQFQSTLSSLASKFGASPALALKSLPLYADLLSKLSPARAQQVGKQLGLDQGTILLLQQGRREIEDVINRQKELGLVTEADADKYILYGRSITQANQASERFFNHLARDAIPTLTNFQKIRAAAFGYLEHHTGAVEATFGLGSLAAGGGFLASLLSGSGPIALASRAALLAGGAVGAAVIGGEDIYRYHKGAKGTITGRLFGGEIREDINRFGNEIFQNLAKKTIESLPFFNKSISQLPNSPLIGAQPIVYNLGPTTINTESTDAAGLLADLNKYTSGQFNSQLSQATNHFVNAVAM